MRGSGRDIVAFDLIDQRGPGDAELDGRPSPVAGMVLQGPFDMLALEVFQTKWSVAPIAQTGTSPELTGQVFHADGRLASTQDQRALEHGAHFPNIPGPGIREQPLENITGESRGSVRKLRTKITHQPGDERKPIFP